MMNNSMYFISLFFITLFFLSSCNRDKKLLPLPAMELMSADSTGIYFENRIKEGIEFNPLVYVYAYNGGGVATGDLDNDGYPEVLFTSNQKGCTLYHNKGNLKFEDITSAAAIHYRGGWYTGITLADVNGDGWLDIYLCRSGLDSLHRSNLLYINNKNLTFSEKANEYGLDDNAPSTHACFFDYDNDGDLDVFIANHPDDFSFIYQAEAYVDVAFINKSLNKMLENQGGKFVDVTTKCKIPPLLTYSLSVSAADINNDGFADLYVANDFFSPDMLLLNNGDKTFTDQIKNYTKGCSLFAMGTSFGDINNDGYNDLMEVDMLPDNHYRLKASFLNFSLNAYDLIHNKIKPAQYIKNHLFVSNEGQSFTDIAEYSGVAKTDWSWSVLLEDFDNDKWKDIFVGKGLKRDYFDLDFMMLQSERKRKAGFKLEKDTMYRSMPGVRLPNYLYHNNANLHFSNVTEQYKMAQPVATNGAMAADLDLDGDLDLVLNNTDTSAFIYRNNHSNNTNNHYIRFSINTQTQNTNGVGAKVIIYSNDSFQYKQSGTTQGFESSPEDILHFGLGKDTVVDSVLIVLPDKTGKWLYKLRADSIYNVTVTKNSIPVMAACYKKVPWLLQDTITGLNYEHRESPFCDFKKDRLFFSEFSKEGPGVAVADINRDGLEDLFIGGAYQGSPSKLYLQKINGTFKEMKNQPWSGLIFENLDAIFADFNKDGFPDLYLCNGTNELNANDTLQKNRLFINQKGVGFFDASNLFPPIEGIKSAPLSYDFDQDGDLDLFVGTRMIPGQYPTGGRCYLLENTPNGFVDRTADWCPELLHLGNVVSSSMADLDKDGFSEILIAAEYQPLKIYRVSAKGILKPYNLNAEINQIKGLWKIVSTADIDNDGDLDILLGNEGGNSYLQASVKEPITIYYNDFDDNGVNEPLVFHYINGQKNILYDRNTYCEQMPKFRNKFLTYKSYANAGFDDLVPVKKQKGSAEYNVTCLKSIWLENLGNGQFKVQEFDNTLQLSAVNCFLSLDINKDALLDLLIGTNSNNFLYWAGQTNNSYTVLLKGMQKNAPQIMKLSESGIHNKEVCKKVISINRKNTPVIMLVNNDGKSVVMKSAKFH